MISFFHQFADYVYVIIGLGFLIFIHELGHFLAAKSCGVCVEQFAVGFGKAIFAYRKGIGFRQGGTQPEFQKLTADYLEGLRAQDIQYKEHVGAWTDAQIARAAQDLNLGETEYRLNWVPLGGYVKMLGQDDLKPGAVADDPRAFNNKPIRSRMIIVSAGVIMNIFFAVIAFMIVFMIGYPAPPAQVGGVLSNSPAARAGLQPGDTILSINGHDTMDDFTKVALYSALSHEGAPIPIQVQHLGEKSSTTLIITPQRADPESGDVLQIGVAQPTELLGLPVTDQQKWDVDLFKRTTLPDSYAVRPGEKITMINGRRVDPTQFWTLNQAFANSNGNPVAITIQSPDGSTHNTTLTPHFASEFAYKEPLNLLGMVPRCVITEIDEHSPAIDKLQPGDIVVSVAGGPDQSLLEDPDLQSLRNALSKAGESNNTVTLTVLGLDGKTRVLPPLLPNVPLPGPGNKKGLNIALSGYDEQHLVVASINQDSPAFGEIPPGSTLQSVQTIPAGAQSSQSSIINLSTWFQLRDIIADAKPNEFLRFKFLPPNGAAPKQTEIALTPADIQHARDLLIDGLEDVALDPLPNTKLKTSNPITALVWGAVDTRDLVLQFYLTLHRMRTGDVGINNTMGPLGMAAAGAAVASRGFSWYLWFLANISANLAVVNFLPLPIVDGGLFTLLIVEKIRGKRLPASAERIIQLVGLVLILGVFLLVTRQDIMRMISN